MFLQLRLCLKLQNNVIRRKWLMTVVSSEMDNMIIFLCKNGSIPIAILITFFLSSGNAGTMILSILHDSMYIVVLFLLPDRS